MAALVHRMNGALNNASMALEIALGHAARDDPATEQTLRAGVVAMARASRAAALLAYLAHGKGAPDDADGAYARDVREILGEHARSTGAMLAAEPDAPAIDPRRGAADAANLLVSELARSAR